LARAGGRERTRAFQYGKRALTPAADSYLLNLRGVDWARVLASWGWMLPRRFSLLFINRFGDVFIVQEDESIHMLNLATGTLERLADRLEDFADLLEVDVLRENWLLTRLVDACIEAGLELGPNQIYGYKIPPSLGGAMDLENVEITDIPTHFHGLAEIQQQLDDMNP
jgi:hypothetical protein